jgi:hypothetical protein
MNLAYRTQSPYTLFDGVTMTDDFADNRIVLDVGGMSKLAIDLSYTAGATRDLKMKVESSIDKETWHSLVIDETSTESVLTERVWSVANTGTYNVILDIAYKHVRISFREDGTGGFGTLTAKALASGL